MGRRDRRMAKITETLLTLNVMGDAHVAKVFGCQALHEVDLGPVSWRPTTVK